MHTFTVDNVVDFLYGVFVLIVWAIAALAVGIFFYVITLGIMSIVYLIN